MRVDDLDDRTHADIAARQLDDLAAIGLTWDEPARVADAASTPLRRRRRGARRTRAAVRMLLQQKGYPAGTARTARAAGRLSRNMPRPDRRRARDAGATRPAGRPRCGCAPTRSPTRFTICCTANTPESSTTSWSAAATAWPPTTSPSSSTMRHRASTRWCAATTCWRRRRARRTSRTCWATRSRRTRTSRWCSTRTGRGWPNATAPSRSPRSACQRALAQIAESLGWQASSLDEMLAQFDPAKLPRATVDLPPL